MRYASDHKARTRERIVRQAATDFRRHGLDGVGIAQLMGKLGLTHGGFYAHFPGKDDLVGEVVAAVIVENLERMCAVAEEAAPGRAVEAIVAYYLSPVHRDNPDMGCLLPALASELARRPVPVRVRFTSELVAALERLAGYMPGETPEERLDRGIVLLSSMAGTILIARALSDRVLQDRVLSAASRALSSVADGDGAA